MLEEVKINRENMSDYKVIHKKEEDRFEVWEDGALGYVEYYVHDGGLDILHTIVSPRLEGRGVGSALVHAAYDWARSHKLKPLATCRFAIAWLRRHPDYND
jgi:predicted GNAT family acetyltransferase